MKHSCYVKHLLLFVLLHTSLWASVDSKSAMVYYGKNIPYTVAGIHDYIIVQPGHTNTATHGFKLYNEDIYAYVSIGEIEKNQPYYSDVNKAWIIGENTTWNAKVMDIANLEYQEFLLSHVMKPLHEEGFKNFFFDTIDSYHLGAKDNTHKEQLRQGLITFVKAFSQRYPDAKLIVNRGFEVIDEIHPYVDAVLFESYYFGLAGEKLAYTKVKPSAREWLDTQLEKVKSYKKPIIALDYIVPSKKKLIKQNIQDLENKGFIPYVSDRDLQHLGYSSKEAVKRELLLLYDDTEFDGTPEDDVVHSTAFLQVSVPVEYLGYVPVLQPVSTFKVSDNDSRRYAGAIVWLSGNYPLKQVTKFETQMRGLKDNGIKILFLETLSGDKHAKLFKTLGIEKNEILAEKQIKKQIGCDMKYEGFEIDPYISPIGYYIKPKNAQSVCEVTIGNKKSTVAAITPWGGYALSGTVMAYINKENPWVLNPFTFIKDTLRLPDIPIPDPTTENGKRLFFVHVDGDGIMNRAEWDSDLFSGEVLYEEIYKKYVIPSSISIIEAETAKHGLYPEDSEKLEAIAKDIFALEHIEPATHTFTHPFYWQQIVDDHLDEKYRLQVENYDFSVDREINGSLTYINERLTPKNKKANMTFWSGDCLPTETTLAYMYKNNYLQMNGGDTTITNTKPWLSYVAPFGLKRGDYYQVFTGAQNENVYTNDWLGPFWGYKRVIQTFKLTDKPRRLKPIDIYYHIYSGSKRASLKALDTVYKWCVEQDVMPIYTSAYIPKALDFFEVSIAKEKEGWFVKGTRDLKTLRLAESYTVDFTHSKGVLGKKKHQKDNYIHLNEENSHYLAITNKSQNENYLLDSNGKLVDSNLSSAIKTYRFVGEVPLKLSYSLQEGCRLESTPKADTIDKQNQVLSLQFVEQKDVNVTVSCQ